MDAYSSLLNLNFMASLRTGNVVADMLIAMLIPFVSGLIARFFREWWPDFISWLLHFFESRDVETVVAANRETRGNRAVDLDENGFLQSVLMHYVATRVKPTYQRGSYQYKRILSSFGAANCARAPTFVDTLKNLYTTQTVPTKDCAVELSPNLSLCIAENADEADRMESGGAGSGNAGNGGGDDGNNDKKNKLKQKNTTLIFRTRQGYFAGEDAMMSLANRAFEEFKVEKKKAVNNDRYLYQPLMRSEAKADEEGSPPLCQRYPLSREKTFATLFFPEKEALMRLIRQFENKTGKFAVPGFPRKLILLLYGPPGTGKTSLVKAIAELTRRNIFSIPLSRVKTNRQLLDYMFDTAFTIKNAPKRNAWADDHVERLQADSVIYMLEDVDAASEVVRRKSTPSPPPCADAASPASAEERSTATEKGATTEPESDNDRNADMDESSSPSSAASEKTVEALPSGHTESAKAVLIKEDDDSTDDDGEGDEDADRSASPSKVDEGHDGDSGAESGAATAEKCHKKSKKAKKGPTVDRVIIGDDANGGGLFGVDKDKLSIKGLLEAFGGILDAPGRIVIMTTNHIEHLDPALLRPGIVTMKLRMGNFDAECGLQMVRHYFSTQYRDPNANQKAGRAHGDDDDKDEDEGEEHKPVWDEKQLAEVARIIEEANSRAGGFSPAEVEQLCAENDSLEDLLVALKRGSRREVF